MQYPKLQNLFEKKLVLYHSFVELLSYFEYNSLFTNIIQLNVYLLKLINQYELVLSNIFPLRFRSDSE